VEPSVSLEAVVKRKIPSPRRESNPKTPIVQLVVHLIRPEYPLTVVDRYNSVVTGWNPCRGMNECPRSSMLYCPV